MFHEDFVTKLQVFFFGSMAPSALTSSTIRTEPKPNFQAPINRVIASPNLLEPFIDLRLTYMLLLDLEKRCAPALWVNIVTC